MRNHPIRAAAFVVVLACSFLVQPHISFAQVFRTTLNSLADVADAVVIAKTVSTESYWNDDHSAILTRVVLDVEESLSGNAAQQTVLIVPGGQVGNYLHEVSDMPVFIEDEEAIVFVERHESGVNVVAGGALGKLNIRTDARTKIRTVSGAGLFLLEDSDTESSEEDVSGKALQLETFIKHFKDRK